MKFRAALILPLLLSACGQSEEQGATSAENGEETSTAQVAGLTPAYLEGQWCYTHSLIGDERSDEMLSYIFAQDGTLLYQNNPSTEIEKPGTYAIDGGSIKIEPTLAFFNMQLESLSQDEMVFKMAYGLMHWSRGACKAQAM
ncbi:hypothetical protein [Parasphingorhabdus sp.]|uniref:hypothetical protein n=1 Tax=Parasphingorhabdus sp. TaxID=2709688 RepID=UPI003C7651A7